MDNRTKLIMFNSCDTGQNRDALHCYASVARLLYNASER